MLPNYHWLNQDAPSASLHGSHIVITTALCTWAWVVIPGPFVTPSAALACYFIHEPGFLRALTCVRALWIMSSLLHGILVNIIHEICLLVLSLTNYLALPTRPKMKELRYQIFLGPTNRFNEYMQRDITWRVHVYMH